MDAGEKQTRGSGGSAEPPGPLLTHLRAVYAEYSERLPTLLTPLAERTCFSQVDAQAVMAHADVDLGLDEVRPAGSAAHAAYRADAPSAASVAPISRESPARLAVGVKVTLIPPCVYFIHDSPYKLHVYRAA